MLLLEGGGGGIMGKTCRFLYDLVKEVLVQITADS